MVEPSGSPNSSSSPPSERLSEEPFPELLESLKDQNIELAIVLSVQQLSSRPPPTFNIGSPAYIGPKSLDNPIRTPENSPTTDSQLGLVAEDLHVEQLDVKTNFLHRDLEEEIYM